ncbi:MAG: DNA gyrase subunit A [Bacteroidetes bacterium]|nr:DNA gyrase subunit A [Bacteroidota bacterium]
MDENLEEKSIERIITINIEEEMKSAYIDYSMSVIVSRALPDVRDGLKPVHRRVLFGMTELGLAPNRPYKKSARIVGEVMGKYHPHGDSSVYDTMVRMAQDWSLRYAFVDGQGNFGSIDGDSPAAMRYTEARLRKIAEEMLNDLEKDTVDFRPNFDDSLKEPTVLPSKIPNLLVNGASGIAVGMATNMAPHNLREAIDATVAYVDNKDIEISELMTHIKGPDFPTGAIIYGVDGIKNAFETGRGRILMRGKTEIEPFGNGKELIIVTEVPYQVMPNQIITRAVDLVQEKVIDGIVAIRDESGRQGMRIVFELRKDAIANVVLNQLYKYTSLQSSFSVNNIALVNGKPEMLNLKDMIKHFVAHRHEVVVRRTKYDLEEAKKRAHILEGLLIALDHLDEVIALIRSSKNGEEAKEGLISKFGLTEIQAKAILDLRLQRLTGLERQKIKDEFDELMKVIAYLESILNDEAMRFQIIKDELLEMREKYGDDRKTLIEHSAGEIDIEDMIPNESVVLTISHMGYIKRTSLNEYKEQNRGGRGNKGVSHRDEDFVEHLFVANTHNYMLFFTEQGRCFWMKVYEIPEGSKTTKGRAIQNLIAIPPDDKIKAYLNIVNLKDPDYLNTHNIILCTKKGIIKKTTLEAYSRPRSNGINAITVREGDELLEARLTNGNCEIIMAKKSGKAIRFNEKLVRPMGRNASGVKGVTLENENDVVIGMLAIDKDQLATATVLVVSEKGYGKRSFLVDPETGEDEYRVTGRGGKGVKTLKITEKTGNLISINNVNDEDGLMIINKSGLTIRMRVDSLRTMGRATQGVKLINIKNNDAIASLAVTPVEEDEELYDENGNPIAVAPTIDEDGNPIIIENPVIEDSDSDTADDDTEDSDDEAEDSEDDAEDNSDEDSDYEK